MPIPETPDLGTCRPGTSTGAKWLTPKARGAALSHLRPLSDYRAAKARAAKSAIAVFIGAILAVGGFYLGWRVGLLL